MLQLETNARCWIRDTGLEAGKRECKSGERGEKEVLPTKKHCWKGAL